MYREGGSKVTPVCERVCILWGSLPDELVSTLAPGTVVILSRSWDLFLLTCPDCTLTLYDLGSGATETIFPETCPLRGMSTHTGRLSGSSAKVLDQ